MANEMKVSVQLTQQQVHMLIAVCEEKMEELADLQKPLVTAIDSLLEVLDEASAKFREL